MVATDGQAGILASFESVNGAGHNATDESMFTVGKNHRMPPGTIYA